MRSISASVSRLLNKIRGVQLERQEVPTVEWLLEHRQPIPSHPIALTKGRTPTAALYRMYEYLVLGSVTGLRTEVELFFNQPSWAVADIPDPRDPDPQRQAILAVLPFYLTVAFNRLIERGLARGSPAIITPAVEEELRSRPIVLEREPAWVARVPRLATTLVIPDESGKHPTEARRSPRFLDLNIIAEEPQVLFV